MEEWADRSFDKNEPWQQQARLEWIFLKVIPFPRMWLPWKISAPKKEIVWAACVLELQ